MTSTPLKRFTVRPQRPGKVDSMQWLGGNRAILPRYSQKRISMPKSPNESDKSRHAFLRRVIAPSFSPSSLRALEITMKGYFDDMIQSVAEIADRDGGVVDMNVQFHNLAFEVYYSGIAELIARSLESLLLGLSLVASTATKSISSWRGCTRSWSLWIWLSFPNCGVYFSCQRFRGWAPLSEAFRYQNS